MENYTVKTLLKLSKKEKLNLMLSNKIPAPSYKLKNWLFEHNLKEKKCEKCLNTEWQGFPIPLEIHHVNGNHFDNVLNNIQVLCSNCHSLSPNFAGGAKRKEKRTLIQYKQAIESSYCVREACVMLGLSPKGGNYPTIKNLMSKYGFKFLIKPQKDIIKEPRPIKIPKSKNKYSSKEEAFYSLRKVKDRPDSKTLLYLIWMESTSKLASKYGITDNAVKKWCNKYNIPKPPVGYWAKFNNNHFEECELIKKELFLKYNLELQQNLVINSSP